MDADTGAAVAKAQGVLSVFLMGILKRRGEDTNQPA